MAVIEQRRISSDVQPSIHGMGAIFGRRAFAWGGVWAGALTASALQLLCGLVADPSSFLLGGQVPVTGVSAFAGVWYLIYTAGALFIGGMIAGQTGGGAGNRVLHGLVTWTLSSLGGFYGLAIWAGQLNLGPGMPVMPEMGDAGLALISRGWMLSGLLIGLCAALFGAAKADSRE